MFKRICPNCFTRWYSSFSTDEAWVCDTCKTKIPKSQESVAGNGKSVQYKEDDFMKRLTMCIDTKVFYSQNGNPILPVEMLETPLVREVLKKLAEYEDIGAVDEFKETMLQNTELIKSNEQLMNRCYVLSKGTLCLFCGLKDSCKKH